MTSKSSQKIGRSQWLIVAMAAAVVQLLGGWETTLAQTDKEREAEQTLHDLTISMTPEPTLLYFKMPLE